MKRTGVLFEVEFTTITGNTYTAADTALNEPLYGTQAFNAYKRGDKIVPVIGESECWLNFYAIEKACVTKTPTEEEFEDANCTKESE